MLRDHQLLDKAKLFFSREMYFSLNAYNLKLLALLSGLSVFLLLFIFEPFMIYQHSLAYKLMLSFSFSLVPVITIFIIGWFYLRNPKRKRIYSNQEFLAIFLVGILIAILLVQGIAYLIMVLIFPNHFRIPEGFALSLIYYTLIFAIVIYLIARGLDLFSFYLKNIPDNTEEVGQEKIIINSNNVYSFSIENILFIESEKNNARFHLMRDEKLEEILVEYCTLRKIEDDYGYPKTNLFRCHKSFIVNLSNLDSIRGNSRSTIVKLRSDFIIPVSRDRRELLIERIRRQN